MNVFGDHAGGLWALGERDIVHLKDGVVTSHFSLEGLETTSNNISEDPDGSLWVVRGEAQLQMHPFAVLPTKPSSVSENQMEYRFPRPTRLLADGNGGFWLGGQTGLVHWHDGVSETYPIKALKLNAGAGSSELGAWSRWISLGWHTCRRTRARTWTVEEGHGQTIRDPHV